MGLEGNASRVFFASYFSPLGWRRREPRCKRDVYNVLLDIGYTLLFQFIEAMLSLYGFDLYCGVLHTFFYQRKSLVCDIVEPFRCIIDQRIRKAHNLGQIDEEDFFLHNGMYNLEWKSQSKYVRLFLKDILERKEDIFKFCQQYYRWFMKDLPVSQFPKFCIKEK
jgi:CRISPR-associated protein Cas1